MPFQFTCERCKKTLPIKPAYVAGRRFCSRACRWAESLDERFWSRVRKTASCWLWQGALNSSGYGSIRVGSRGSVNAARVSWELTRGPIPQGLYVCHTCDVRSCVRPEHLFLGTHAQNMADMGRKGRAHRHPDPLAAISDVVRCQVVECHKAGMSQRRLAATYRVSRHTIAKIITEHQRISRPL